MARNRTTATLGLDQKIDRKTSRLRASLGIALTLALVLGLSLFGGTRAFDSLRAASYFLRTRKGPAISLQRFDQEIQFAQDYRYAVARARR